MKQKIAIENMNRNEMMPIYNVAEKNYTNEEKNLLRFIRENLIDIAISSGENFQVKEDVLLNDIKHSLYTKLQETNPNTNISNE